MSIKINLGIGGVSEEAQTEYLRAVEKAEAAYAAIMESAPKRKGLMRGSENDTLRDEFVSRAQAAYDAIEQPAAEKRNAQWINGK